MKMGTYVSRISISGLCTQAKKTAAKKSPLVWILHFFGFDRVKD